MTYEEWSKEVDNILYRKIGLFQEDLEDWLSRDAFDADVTPEEAASLCLENAGIDESLIDET